MSKNEKFDLPLSETEEVRKEKKIHKGRIILIASAVSAVLLFVFILIFQIRKNGRKDGAKRNTTEDKISRNIITIPLAADKSRNVLSKGAER